MAKRTSAEIYPSNRRRDLDDDCEPVIVPRNEKTVVPIQAQRRRRLRKHLVKVLRQLGTERTAKLSTSVLRPEPGSFAAIVAGAACALCKGWCCRKGDDDGFLDHSTIARLLYSRTDLDARAVVRLYTDRVPPVGYEGSCIFHGEQGCTLHRTLRADICNVYFCGGLDAYIRTGAAVPTRIIAGEGIKMRTSPALVPAPP